MFQFQPTKTLYVFNTYVAEVIKVPPFMGHTVVDYQSYLTNLNQQQCLAALNAYRFKYDVGMCVVMRIPYLTITPIHPNFLEWMDRNPLLMDYYKSRPKGHIEYITDRCLTNGIVQMTVDPKLIDMETAGTTKKSITSTLEYIYSHYPEHPNLKVDDVFQFEDIIYLHTWVGTIYPKRLRTAYDLFTRIKRPENIIELNAGPSVMTPIAKDAGLIVTANDSNINMVDIANALGHNVSYQTNNSVIVQNLEGTYWLIDTVLNQPRMIPQLVRRYPNAKVVVIETLPFEGKDYFDEVCPNVYIRNIELNDQLDTGATEQPSVVRVDDEGNEYPLCKPGSPEDRVKVITADTSGPSHNSSPAVNHIYIDDFNKNCSEHNVIQNEKNIGSGIVHTLYHPNGSAHVCGDDLSNDLMCMNVDVESDAGYYVRTPKVKRKKFKPISSRTRTRRRKKKKKFKVYDKPWRSLAKNHPK